jgi:DNA-binding transcriptional ArsR family regulator
MNSTDPIAALAELIAERSRAAILVALLDGRSLTAGELALIANVSAQSASAHLSRMVVGGLLKALHSGRHRYYRLAGPDIAHAVEALAAIATRLGVAAGSTRRDEQEIRHVRSCYDHLAGRIAVEMAKFLEASKIVRTSGERDYELDREGRRWLSDLGIDFEVLRCSRRSFARQCLDWTERKPHIAGALGAELCARTLALGWFARRRGARALRVTPKGVRELRARFGINA